MQNTQLQTWSGHRCCIGGVFFVGFFFLVVCFLFWGGGGGEKFFFNEIGLLSITLPWHFRKDNPLPS